MKRNKLTPNPNGSPKERALFLAQVKTVLDRIADKMLSYRVPARTKKAKKRARKRRKVQRESCI